MIMLSSSEMRSWKIERMTNEEVKLSPTEQRLSVLSHDCCPLSRHLLQPGRPPVLRGQEVTRELEAQLLKTADHGESPSDFITEESLAELKHGPHGEGEIEEINILVSHREVFLTDREDLADLLGGPDGQVAQSETSAVKYVGESPHLVLLILQQGLKYFFILICEL